MADWEDWCKIGISSLSQGGPVRILEEIIPVIQKLHAEAWERYGELCKLDQGVNTRLSRVLVEISHLVSKADIWVASLQDLVAAGQDAETVERLRGTVDRGDTSFLPQYLDQLFAHLFTVHMRLEGFEEQLKAATRVCDDAIEECQKGERDTARHRNYARVLKRSGQASAFVGGVGLVGGTIAGFTCGLPAGPVGGVVGAGAGLSAALVGGLAVDRVASKVAKAYTELNKSLGKAKERFQELSELIKRVSIHMDEVKTYLDKVSDKMNHVREASSRDITLAKSALKRLHEHFSGADQILDKAAFEIRETKVSLYERLKAK